MAGINNLTSIPPAAHTPANQGNVPIVEPTPFQQAEVTISAEEPQTLGHSLGLDPAITPPRNGTTAVRARERLRATRSRTEQQRVTTRVPDRGPVNSTPRNSAPSATSQRSSYSSSFSRRMQSDATQASLSSNNTMETMAPAATLIPEVLNTTSTGTTESINTPRTTPSGEGVITTSSVPTALDADDADLFGGFSTDDTVQLEPNLPANNSTIEPTAQAQSTAPATDFPETGGAESTTLGAEGPVVNTALHFDSFRAAAEGYQQGQTQFELQMTTTSTQELSDLLRAILQPSSSGDPTFGGDVHWCESTQSSASAIVSVDARGFLRAVGAGSTFPGMVGMSAEGVNTLEGRANIHEQAAERGEIQQQNAFTQRYQSTRVCIPREYTDEPANQGERFVCREASTYSQELLEPDLRAFYEENCVDTTFVVGDGIDGGSSVSNRVQSTVSLDGVPTYDPETNRVSSASTQPGAQALNTTQTSLANNMATRLTQVMARYCTTTAYVDVRATQQVQGDAAANIPDSTTLSSVRLLQALAEVLDMLRRNATAHVDVGGPEVQIVIYDVDETPGYHPDLRPLREMVGLLAGYGVNIYAYSSSPGSYLARIGGIILTSSIAEIVSRTSERVLPPRGYGSTEAALLLSCIATGVLVLRYVRERVGRSRTRLLPEENGFRRRDSSPSSRPRSIIIEEAGSEVESEGQNQIKIPPLPARTVNFEHGSDVDTSSDEESDLKEEEELNLSGEENSSRSGNVSKTEEVANLSDGESRPLLGALAEIEEAAISSDGEDSHQRGLSFERRQDPRSREARGKGINLPYRSTN